MVRRRGPGGVTIRDVAQQSGVSIKTVSRVLNDEPHVSDDIRARVNQAVAALGYRLNPSARSLSSSRSFLIGAFFDDPASGYASALQFGALTRCRARGYHLIVETIDPSAPDVRAEIGRILSALRLDGVILPPPLCDNPLLLDMLDEARIGYVRISPDGDLDRSAFVQIDDEAAAFVMTMHLVALGHRDIGFVMGDPKHGATRRRFDGYRAALARAGLTERPERVRAGDFSFRSGQEAGEALLSGERRPSAVFASNDDMALGVLAAANRLGIAAPDRLSVAGFDDSPSSRVVWPQLTTIRQPNAELAATAVDLLVDGTPVSALLDFELVVRGTTGPAPPERREGEMC